MSSMEIPIIKIGNSKGILLSKWLLKRYHFGEKVEVIMKEDRIEIIPILSVRKGWDEKFEEMHQRGDDQLFIDELPEDEDLEEWK